MTNHISTTINRVITNLLSEYGINGSVLSAYPDNRKANICMVSIRTKNYGDGEMLCDRFSSDTTSNFTDVIELSEQSTSGDKNGWWNSTFVVTYNRNIIRQYFPRPKKSDRNRNGHRNINKHKRKYRHRQRRHSDESDEYERDNRVIRYRKKNDNKCTVVVIFVLCVFLGFCVFRLFS